MVSFFRRFADDVRRRRYLDAYAAGFVAFAMAAVTIFVDTLGDELRWAAALAGIGITVLRLTSPENRAAATRGASVGDRSVFDDNPLAERLKTAREVCVFAPSAVNVLSEQYSETLRRDVLGRRQGRVRVIVLDPAERAAVSLAVRQLDESLDYQRSDLRADLGSVVEELRRMSEWDVEGNFEFGFLPYNPGFSLLALNPNSSDGVVLVELHGFHNESTAKRMHVEFTRGSDPYWYEYWCHQFERMWSRSRVPRTEAEDVEVTEEPRP
ncbi:hypothetical protein DFQ14_10157 [Halopolyspora algeriensis]|uniref:Uncharacterized protein n=1 Tax=Halopolyspora algeriensis TaxID=1500506 RepID=A0A368VXN8_9ACTN|nr:hypothetical protein [Halopolyspora algeriensis]RCW46721.1 hypothetical protein DFQ14_10157 [Halopolyspora algeriensis]TQM46746.1 hypothetical protein FHU43_3867 [Halopolyspora algeriensis]